MAEKENKKGTGWQRGGEEKKSTTFCLREEKTKMFMPQLRQNQMGTWWISDVGRFHTANKAGGFGFFPWVSFSEVWGWGGVDPQQLPAGPWLIYLPSIVLSDLGPKPNQFKETKGHQRIAATVSKARKRKKTFLPKLTKSKLAKQRKRAQYAQHPDACGWDFKKNPRLTDISNGKQSACYSITQIIYVEFMLSGLLLSLQLQYLNKLTKKKVLKN